MSNTQTVTIAQALASTASGLSVLDTAANIAAALPNNSLVSRVTSFSVTATAAAPVIVTVPQFMSLSTLGSSFHAPAGALKLAGPAMVTAAQLLAIEAVPGFTVASGASFVLSDTTANVVALLAQHPAAFAALSGVNVHLDGTSIGAYPATQLEGLFLHGKVLNIVPTGSYTTLNVAAMAHDLGSNNASLSLLALQQPVSFTLLNEGATVIAADAAGLTQLPGFHVAAHTLYVSDTAANVQARAGQLFGQGFTQITVQSGNFAGSAAQLLDPALHFSSGAHALLAGVATVSGAVASALSALPGFALASGATLAVSDTVANLIATDQAWEHVATSATVSANATVTAAGLASLAQLAGVLGARFSEGGHGVTVADTAANIAALPAGTAALAGNGVVTQSAIVSAAVAQALSAMPHLSLASGVTLTVQDSVANLIALGQGAAGVVSVEQLVPGSSVTISAAQGHALAGLPGFSQAGSTITVADSIANLTSAADAGWQGVASATQVIDSAANLAAAATTLLVHNAGSVNLSGNATITAAQASQIATIPHFSASGAVLTVSDTAAAIAANASGVIAVATGAVVSDSGPVSTAVADQLASVSAAHLLTFQGGDQLVVQDSYAALIAQANSAGVALAARINVVDTAANLVTASGHDWGGVNPTYLLSGPAVLTAAQAQVLAGLGSHFSANAYALSEADTASNVAGSGASLSALHITAAVSDTAANIDAQESNLAALGASLAVVHTTDTGAVTASVAAGLAGLASKLSGPPLAVADSAGNVDAVISQLRTLGSHVAVLVTDSAADVAQVATDLAGLGGALSVVLTDSQPVSAVVAAGLAPVAAELAPGTRLSVTDTAADIVAQKAGLVALGGALGTLSLSDGNTQNAATAAALAALDGHLGGAQLSVADTGAHVAANLAALQHLAADGALAGVVVANTTVADAVGNAAALNALPSTVSISDSGADVQAGLAGLAGVGGLTGITLTDSSAPTLTLNIASLSAGFGVLTKIVSPYTLDVSDTGAAVAADITAGEQAGGAGGVLAAHIGAISHIAVSDGQPVALSEQAILAAGIDDSAGSVLGKCSGSVVVFGADVAHLAQLAGLSHVPAQISILDSAQAISADLASGGSSVLVADRALISHIALTTPTPVQLTAGQVLASGVDDNAGSVLAKLSGIANILVTSASISQLSSIHGLFVQPSAIAVVDTGANISADFAAAQSQLLQDGGQIGSIVVSDAAPVVLSASEIETAGVDDAPGALLSRLSGAPVFVTGVLTSDLAHVLGLPVAPAEASITDTAAHVLSGLSTIVADIGKINAINISSGTLTLSAAEAEAAHVDDGPGSLIDLLAGHSFAVVGATVANLPGLWALPDLPGAISITDSSANVAADLTSGNSLLAAHPTTINAVTVTHGVLSLTDAQADTILGTPLLDAVINKLAAGTSVSVSGVPVADIANLTGGNLPNVTLAVSDTPAAIAADLASGSNSMLAAHSSSIGSVALSASGTVNAQALSGMAGLAAFSDAGHSLTVQDTAAAIIGLNATQLGFATAVSVQDTDANVASNLDALQSEFQGALSITLTNNAPNITVGLVQYDNDRATIDAITNPGSVTATGSATFMGIGAAMFATDPVIGQVRVIDAAASVIGNLSSLQVLGGKLSVQLTDSSISAADVIPLLSIANLSPSNIPVVDTGAAIAALAESGNTAAVHYLTTAGSQLSATGPVGAIDAAALEGLSGFSLNGHTLQVWDTAAHLTAPAYASALSNSAVSGVYLKAPGGVSVVSAATAVALFNIAGFSTHNPDGSSNVLNVSDTAAHIDAVVGSLSGVSNVIVNASAQVSEQVLSDLAGVHAQTAAGVSLTVADTAAHIADAVASPVAGAITPVGYVLSANGSVTEAEAVTLGNLAVFNAAGHVITLNAGSSSLNISVADAMALGNIAGSLNLGGTTLVVHGTVAQLSVLSPAALGLVSPAVADSFGNVAALPSGSPLLHGTVEITDAAPVLAAEAQSLLSLPVAPGSLTIDHVHALVDTIADLRTLESSAAWTSQSSLHASFNVIAVDSVANLINPANASLLSTVAQSTVPGNVTIDAADASSLASAANAIHFTAGAAQIVVSDTAAHLVAAEGSNGLALATGVTLSGPGTLDAADAASLLQIAHLQLTQPLTVIDSSADLINGPLAMEIAGRPDAGFVSVQLAGPETLDANTAEALAQIPGFNDAPHDLTIADAPSYLLNSGNLGAEQIASVVTLDGDESVSANTVLRLSQVPHFNPESSHLVLAGNDYADAPTARAIADMGSAFQANGHTVTLTQDVTGLTPTEAAALQNDGIVGAGHVLGVNATNVSVGGGMFSATGVAGGVVSVFDATGHMLSSTPEVAAAFTVSVPGAGQNYSVSESFSGGSVAPLVVLDANALESSVAAAQGSFASSGAIAVDSGKFIDLYLAGTVPAGLGHAALVYDPSAHAVSLDVPGSQPVTLVTLGGSAMPTSLAVAEILIKHVG